MSHIKRLFEGVVVLSATSVLAAITSYFIRLVLARTLSLEDFGLYFSIFSFMGFFLMFRDLGIGVALVRSITKFKAEKQYANVTSVIVASLLIQFITSTAIILILLMIAKPLSIYFFKKAEAELILLLFLFYIYFSIIAITIKSLLLGFQKNTEYSLSELIKNIGTLITILVGSYFLTNSYLPLAGYTVGWLFLIIFLTPSAVMTFNLFKYKIINLRNHMKKLLFFGLPVLFSDVGSKVIGNTDTLMLTYFTSLELVGIYNVVLPSALMFMFITNGIVALILPVASELLVKNQKLKLEKILCEIYKVWLVLFLPVFALLIIFSQNFLLILFGDNFLQGTLPLQIVFAGTFFLFASDINNRMLIGFGKPKLVLWGTLVAGLVNVILNYFLITQFNMVGAAIATSICYFLMFILSFKFIKKSIIIKIQISTIMKSLLITSLIIIINFFIGLPKNYSPIEIVAVGIINLTVLLLFNLNYVILILNTYFKR